MTGTGTDRDTARERFRAWVTERFDDPAALARSAERLARATTVAKARGGVDLRSCRNGDLFVCWTADGVVRTGLEPTGATKLSAEVWQRLTKDLAAEAGVAVHGRVVCDYARVLAHPGGDTDVHHKAAPGSLPTGLADWLGALAAALRDAGDNATADALDSRLPQFRSTD